MFLVFPVCGIWLDFVHAPPVKSIKYMLTPLPLYMSHTLFSVTFWHLSSLLVVQVVLCFSPVGTTLRVRARKFPAIVNCTSIDWFHEWPEEALISVSSRFLSEVELIKVNSWVGSYFMHNITKNSTILLFCPATRFWVHNWCGCLWHVHVPGKLARLIIAHSLCVDQRLASRYAAWAQSCEMPIFESLGIT